MRSFLKAGLMMAALCLGGCLSLGGVSDDTRFYRLEAVTAISQSPSLARVEQADLGLGPVRLPDTLDRPQIVTRGEHHRLRLAEFDHWAGSLQEDVARVLRRSLMVELPALRIVAYPWPGHQKPRHQVRIDILRFDGALGGTSVLEGTWSLVDRVGGREIGFRHFRLEEQASGAGYDALVGAYSRLLARLSAQIAADVRSQFNAGAAGKAGPCSCLCAGSPGRLLTDYPCNSDFAVPIMGPDEPGRVAYARNHCGQYRPAGLVGFRCERGAASS